MLKMNWHSGGSTVLIAVAIMIQLVMGSGLAW
jgi:hypothetical protein